MKENGDQPSRKRTGIRRSLLDWYRRNARDLPWRRTDDPYRIWLSEVLLQQTRIGTAQPYYHRFTQAFPDVRALAGATEDQVLKLWEGLGYYSRARNLHRAARVLVTDHDGRFPETAEGLRRLPGVGRYTAGAVASIAFGKREPAVDGNVKRVLSRLFAVEACVDESAVTESLWALAGDLVPPGDPGAFNQAVMELGARICTPRVPRCVDCPAGRWCEARALCIQASLPRRRGKKPVPHHEIVAAAICKRGRYLLGKRPSEGLLGGLWELPGGKVEPGETHEEALVRELREEVGIDVQVGEPVAKVDHAYSHFKITLHVYRCDHTAGRPRAEFHDELKWVPRAHFDRYAFPAANRKFLHKL